MLKNVTPVDDIIYIQGDKIILIKLKKNDKKIIK